MSTPPAKFPTLTIEPRLYDTGISLKGLSFKAVRHTRNFGSHLCRNYDSDGKYYIDSTYLTDGRTAKIKKDTLIEYLKELYRAIPFGKIKMIGHYELTGEQLMEEVLKENQK